MFSVGSSSIAVRRSGGFARENMDVGVSLICEKCQQFEGTLGRIGILEDLFDERLKRMRAKTLKTMVSFLVSKIDRSVRSYRGAGRWSSCK